MPTTMTITEALAEIKTVTARLQKNLEFIRPIMIRDERVRDPYERLGTSSAEEIRKKRQASHDLRERVVKLRSAIAKRNQSQTLEIEGVSRTLADWIVWRREISRDEKLELDQLAQLINQARGKVRQHDASKKDGEGSLEIVVHIDERELAEARDRMEKTLGILDGQLSLKNATTLIEVDD